MKNVMSAILATAISASSMAQDVTLSDEDARVVIDRSLMVIEGQIGDFQSDAHRLHDLAQHFCEKHDNKAQLTEGLTETYRSWVAIEFYHFGPIEQQSASLAINFWPDKKAFVQKHMDQFDALDDDAKETAEGVRSLSVALQGLPAMADLIEAEKCPEMLGVSANIALHGDEIFEGWFGDDAWADVMRSAGADNQVYFSPQEAVAEIYSAISFGIQRAHARLEQPLGTFQNPLPSRTEGGELGIARSLIAAQLGSIQELIHVGFRRQIPPHARRLVETKIEDAIDHTVAIPVPLHEAVATPDHRIPVETAMQHIDAITAELAEEIAPRLGVNAGFTPADGD